MLANSKQCQQRGVTLIETLIAVLVLSVGLLGLVHVTTASIRINRSSKSHISNLSTAQKILEDFKNRLEKDRNLFDTISSGTKSFTLDGEVTATASTVAFTVTWTAENVTDSKGQVMLDTDGMPLLKLVTVRAVAQRSAYGGASNATLTAQILRPSSGTIGSASGTDGDDTDDPEEDPDPADDDGPDN